MIFSMSSSNLQLDIYIIENIEYSKFMSVFKVRRLSQHSSKASKQKNQQKLKVQPEKVVFQINESMNKIFKLKITNLFSQIVEFQIKQPSQPCFKLKFSKKILSPNQFIQMFIFYNPQLNLGNINDQIIINSNINQGYKLKIPIFVRNADQLRKMKKYQRRKSKGKENLKIIRLQTMNRHIGQNKRKAGILYSVNKYKSAQNSYNQNNLTGRIQRFQQEFTRIQNFLKEKTIKSEIYRGEKPITKQEHYDIVFFNVTIEMMIKEIMKQKIIKRYKSQKSKNGPSIRVLDNIKLRWNKNRNEPKITYIKGLQKLLRQVRNFVIYHRFKKMNKILSIYRNLREEQNIEQPQTKIINKKLGLSVQQIGSEDSSIWNHDQDRQYHLQIQQKKKHDYYCRKINKIIGNKKEKNLGADFTQFTLSPRIIPMDFQAPQSKKNQTFQIKSRIGFDNWVTLQESTPYNHELTRYSKIQRIFQWECHPNYQFKSIFQTKKYSENQTILTKKISEKSNKSQEEKNTSKSMIQQMLKGNLDELQKQYSEVCLKKYSTYKNYQKTPTQCDFLLKNQFFHGQTEALKPLKLNSNAIQSIKEEDYVSYYSTPRKHLSLNFLDNNNLNCLIYNVRRDDIIDFDQVSQLTERKMMCLERREQLGQKTGEEGHYLQQILNCTATRQRMQEVNEKKVQNHEIIENVVRTKERKMNIGQRRVKSYNWYVKNTNNIIYF